MAKRDRNQATAAAQDALPLKVETTLGKLVGAGDALGRLTQHSLPMKPAYHIAKLARLASDEIKVYHDKRQALVKELGEERDANPLERAQGNLKVFEVKTENLKKFTDAMNELAEIAVTVAWGPVPVKWLEAISITPSDLIMLEPVLTEVEPPAR